MKDPDQHRYEQRQMVKAYQECFRSPAGQTVLNSLMDEYYDQDMDSTDTNQIFRQVGERRVIKNILDIIKIEVQADGSS